MLLFLSLISASAFALPVYTVGVEDIDYMPIFSSTHNPENFKGYARDVLDRFAKSEKIEFRYVALPVKRFIYVYQSGKLDFAFPDNPNWNLPKKDNLNIIYSNPIITFQDAIFVRPEKLGLGIEKMKVLGTLKGFSAWKFQKYIDSGKMRVESTHAPESLIHMALLGRVDGINMAQQVARYHLKKIGNEKGLVPDPQLLPSQDSYYYFSTLHHPEIIKKLNLFLKKDAANIHELKNKYGL
ncbi:transporter substrate-binding domain-containing protein [Bacteriovorax sp. PP10]|uniref:Transporter substrate-binding domain-containing protein n=1 Tax=Bacteriovorax antarcticus TaxID=3088717 RepID=A0ABU5VSF6_9BACT|nr:transporter substrate-binding domain-containing protein [Bacteriovorax sp. PP10]MEA9355993.1 transporter substrate-binding domain-containing protein [Bacteriovorax sp. PP10]